jgi:hypothetical protein
LHCHVRSDQPGEHVTDGADERVDRRGDHFAAVGLDARDEFIDPNGVMAEYA